MKLLRVALPVPIYREFDYLAPEDSHDDRGRLVRVRIGRRRVLGVVVGNPQQTEVPAESLIAIEEYADEVPRIPDDVLSLAEFASAYYQFPLGMTLQHAVPPRGRRAPSAIVRPPAAYKLTELGDSGIERLPQRARRQRGLADAFASTPVLTRAESLRTAPASLLRRWLDSGWIAAAEPERNVQANPQLRLPPLSDAQQSARTAIDQANGGFDVLLLHGVTGSGKTEVYLASAAAVIARGYQVLMLVPEINLTPQLAERIRRALPDCEVVLLHSHLPDSQRLETWRQAAACRAQFVLGTRLAVFAPLPKLGLIVVDEENDLSYKQQDGLRYNARDLAVYRARIRGIPVVLGSATPALETVAQARRGQYRLLKLPHRAGSGSLPAIRLIPQRKDRVEGGLTAPLIAGIHDRLEKGEQSLLFINRRGYSPSLLCVACAWAATCSRCSARLVVHLSERRLRCHHCGDERPLASACPDCGNQDLLPLGFGTQRLELALREAFPAARIARIDADSTRRKGAWRALLKAILDGDLDILIGTQMMVKGHDFPRLTLVGILGSDNALYSADFRATERLHAQLTQVAGRAGRAELPGEVLIQTDFPGHPVYKSLIAHDEEAYAETLLAERSQLGLPPFARLALLRAEARQRQTTERFLASAHQHALSVMKDVGGVRVSAPVAARLARRAGFERGHVLVQSAKAASLQEFLRQWRPWLVDNAPRTVRWSLDVDPQDVD